MKILILLSVLSLGLAMSSLAGGGFRDSMDIEGTWLPVKAELGGAPMNDEVLKKISLNLEDGEYVVTAENVDKGTYKIDASAKPKTIDIVGVKGPNAGKKLLAIYELHGNTLRVCYNLDGGARPTEFKSPKGSMIFLVIYKRK